MANSLGNKWKIICTLSPYIWGDILTIKIRIIFGFLFIIITMSLNLSIPFLLKNVIQSLNEFHLHPITTNYQSAIVLLLAYGGVYTLSQVTLKTRQIIFYKVTEHAMRLFSLKIFNHLHNLDLKFHLQKKIGEITNSVEKLQHALPEIFWSLALFIIPTVTEVILAITILFYLYPWTYGMILLGTLFAFAVFSAISIQWTTAAQINYDRNMRDAHGYMVDSLINYETVRHFNNRKYESTIFDRLLERVEYAALRFRVQSDFTQMIQGTIVGIGLCILTWQSGHEVMAGTLHIGDFIIINSYLLQFIGPLVNFGWIIVQMNQAFTKLGYVVQLLEEKSEIVDIPNAININVRPAEIIFKNVYFYYHSKRPILQNISFCVPTGNTLAIVGTSGSGKSTIARLLFRFYDVINGQILINNQDIRTITQDSLQSAIGVVAQDTILFNTSLYENILYGNPQATQKDIEAVVKLVRLDNFIAHLPNGYNTLVGERGLKLSGGEKQRISIARALLKKPIIFLFDEATSSLDTVTEQEIKKNIMEVSVNSTTIVITHRLSTITYANEIIVLNNGNIVERGTHNELLQLNAAYAKLWQKQIVQQGTESEIDNSEKTLIC